MVLLKILDIKDFMSKLLIKTDFDEFYMSEMEITAACRYQIKGRLNKSWFSEEELRAMGGREYSYWKEHKATAFQFVKGEKTPLFLKVVFLLAPQGLEAFLEQGKSGFLLGDVEGLYLNMKFEKNQLVIGTGSSLKIFTLDRSLEQSWGEYVMGFLKASQIPYEVISTQH